MPDISAHQIFQWLIMGVSLVGVWFRMQFKIERMEERFSDHLSAGDKKYEELVRQKDAIWAWVDSHQKDSTLMREFFNKELAEIRGEQRVNIEQFRQVLSLLTEIKERLTRLENRE